MSEWISVEERLPTNTEEVFVSDGDRYGQSTATAWFRPSDKTWHAQSDALEINGYSGGYIELDIEVRYWMPIPELPK